MFLFSLGGGGLENIFKRAKCAVCLIRQPEYVGIKLAWKALWGASPEKIGERERDIYIYIYMALTPPGGYAWAKNLKKIPSFTVKNAQNRHPPKRWVLFMSWHFVFFCFFVFSSPWFFISPSISWHLETQKWPTKRGYRLLYIYIYICQRPHKMDVIFTRLTPRGIFFVLQTFWCWRR